MGAEAYSLLLASAVSCVWRMTETSKHDSLVLVLHRCQGSPDVIVDSVPKADVRFLDCACCGCWRSVPNRGAEHL